MWSEKERYTEKIDSDKKKPLNVFKNKCSLGREKKKEKVLKKN